MDEPHRNLYYFYFVNRSSILILCQKSKLLDFALWLILSCFLFLDKETRINKYFSSEVEGFYPMHASTRLKLSLNECARVPGQHTHNHACRRSKYTLALHVTRDDAFFVDVCEVPVTSSSDLSCEIFDLFVLPFYIIVVH